MNIDRHIKRLGAFENGPEFFLVDELAVCQAMDHPTLEPVILNGAFQLVSRGLGRRRRNGRKPGEPVRIALTGLVQPVIGGNCQLRGFFPIETLNPRRPLRQDLHVDTRSVHVLDAKIVEIVHFFTDGGARKSGLVVKFGDDFRIEVMLLNRDDSVAALARHDFLPAGLSVLSGGLYPARFRVSADRPRPIDVVLCGRFHRQAEAFAAL